MTAHPPPSTSSELKVLICSANMGNAEPTSESIASWIPDDGDATSIVENTNYPLPITYYLKGLQKGHYRRETIDAEQYRENFDIIVIGMQEARFEPKPDTVSSLPTESTIESSFLEQDGMNYSSLDHGGGGSGKVNDNLLELIRLIDEMEENYQGQTAGTEFKPSQKKKATFVNMTRKFPFDTMKNNATREDYETKAYHPSEIGIKRAPGDLFPAIRKIKNYANKGISTVRAVTALEHRIRATSSDSDDKETSEQQSNATEYDSRILIRLIAHRCPSYEVIVETLRGEMRLILLVRNDIANEVQDVCVSGKNTGIGSVLANKGGIVVSLTIRKTRLAFLTAHLTAHEGEKMYQGRCANLASILNGAKIGKNLSHYDASISSHHCFVFGDLNYRISLPSMPTHEERVREVYKLVKQKDWDALNKYDGLTKALQQGDCLVGFQTLPCNFPPTFKVKREEGIVYNPQRTPSYTDRILWKSTDGLNECLTPLLYEPCLEYIESDHKPIRGAFSIVANASKPTTKHTQNSGERPSLQVGKYISIWKVDNKITLHFFISSLKCTNLTAMDFNGKADPYIMFVMDPPKMLKKHQCTQEPSLLLQTSSSASSSREKRSATTRMKHRCGWPSTDIRTCTRNPDWNDELFHLVLEVPHDCEKMDLADAMLYVTVMDSDLHSKDDLIGTVAINLSKPCMDYLNRYRITSDYSSSLSKSASLDSTGKLGTRIEEPVLRDGLVKGKLECSIFLGNHLVMR